MKNKNQILNLLNQIINHEEGKDLQHKRASAAKLDYAEASGESFTLNYLKALKKMVEEND